MGLFKNKLTKEEEQILEKAREEKMLKELEEARKQEQEKEEVVNSLEDSETDFSDKLRDLVDNELNTNTIFTVKQELLAMYEELFKDEIIMDLQDIVENDKKE